MGRAHLRDLARVEFRAAALRTPVEGSLADGIKVMAEQRVTRRICRRAAGAGMSSGRYISW